MSLALSLILIILSLLIFIRSKKSALVYFYVFAITNNALQFDIGIAFKIYHLIVIFSIPALVAFYNRAFAIRMLTRPIVIEYSLMLFLGLIFGFLFKFDDPYEHFRMFTQKAEMRAIISSVRLFIELISVLLLTYWIYTKRLNVELFVKVLATIAIINLLIAVVFYLNNNELFRFLFPYDRIAFNAGRFNGLNGEPRAFGRNNAFILLILLFLQSNKNRKVRIYGIISALLGILLSMSASAYIVSLLGLVVYSVYNRRKYLVLIATVATLSFYLFVYNSSVFQSSTITKIQSVLTLGEEGFTYDKVSNDEPDLFARFEIFDRAALNFFYNNPAYIFFGVGPNLISIPASDYVTQTIKNTYIYSLGLNTAPATFLVNTISRTGVVGLILWLIFFKRLYNRINNRSNRLLFIALIFMNFVTSSNLFLMMVGFLLGIALYKKSTMSYGYTKNHKAFLNE